METKRSKTEYGLLIREEGDNEYRHIICRVVIVRRDKASVRNPRHSFGDKASAFFEDLATSCQIDARDHDSQCGSYAWNVKYPQAYHVDLEDAAKMYKTLRRIDKGLYRINEDRGHPQSYGEYVGRVAEVLQIKTFALQTGNLAGGFYSEDDHRFIPKPDGIWTVNDMVRKAKERITKPELKAA